MKSITACGLALLRRARSALGACLALALFLVPLARASTVVATVSGDTVTYSASELAPESKYTVKIENGSTGSSALYAHTSTPQGTIPPSQGTTGDTLAAGTTVHVKVYDKDGELVASTSLIKPTPLRPKFFYLLWMILLALGRLL